MIAQRTYNEKVQPIREEEKDIVDLSSRIGEGISSPFYLDIASFTPATLPVIVDFQLWGVENFRDCFLSLFVRYRRD